MLAKGKPLAESPIHTLPSAVQNNTFMQRDWLVDYSHFLHLKKMVATQVHEHIQIIIKKNQRSPSPHVAPGTSTFIPQMEDTSVKGRTIVVIALNFFIT